MLQLLPQSGYYGLFHLQLLQQARILQRRGEPLAFGQVRLMAPALAVGMPVLGGLTRVACGVLIKADYLPQVISARHNLGDPHLEATSVRIAKLEGDPRGGILS